MTKNNKWFLHGLTSHGDYTKFDNGTMKDHASYTDITKWCSFFEKNTGIAPIKIED